MKRNEGITLIALIITIVILIILTAITINSITSTNLFGLAKGAADNYIQAGKDEEKAIDEMISKTNEIVGGLTGGGTTTPVPEDGENIYTVELQVEEASVTGDTIPIKVANVTKKDELASVARISQVPTGSFTYTYYIETDGEGEKQVSNSSNTYTFSGLDEAKSYTIKVKATDGEGNYGETQVNVLSFSIGNEYYRCTDGMTWREWCASDFNHTCNSHTLAECTVDIESQPNSIGYQDDSGSFHWYVLGLQLSPVDPSSTINDLTNYRLSDNRPPA